MLTMVLGGLWHGAAWTFVIWGAIHGLAQSVEHWRRTARERRRPARAARHHGAAAGSSAIVTFNVVCLAWIFFRAESLDTAFDYLIRMLNPTDWFQGGSPLVTFGVLLAIFVGIAGQFVPTRVHRPG